MTMQSNNSTVLGLHKIMLYLHVRGSDVT